MVRVRVPATSANVGVGFDCLGVALNLYTYFTFEESDKLIIEGCDKRFQNENNLVYTSFQLALRKLNKTMDNVKIVIDSHVPVSRGLGSSSTCVVAGVYGAYALTNTPIDKEAILKICTEIEGHPDNVAPAIYGGLIAAYLVDDQIFSSPYTIDDRFQFLALIPNFETKTEDARKILPTTLPFHVAVHNSAKLSLLSKAFENYDTKMLKVVLNDEIHEPYRKQLIYEYDEVKAICEEIDSVGFYISGSGSTLMNIIQDSNNIQKIEAKLSKLNYEWECKLLQVDTNGACIC